MDKIAQADPFLRQRYNKYFDSKNALFTAVIDELCVSLFQTMGEALLESDSVDSNLQNIATAFVDLIFTEEALAIYRLVISECRDFPELGRLLYEGAPKDLLSQLEHYLIQINKLEHINVVSPAFAADAFLSLLKGELHFQCLLGIKVPPSAAEKKAHINQVITFYSQVFLHDDQ